MAHKGNHIGTLIKPHGYKGELLLKGKPQFLENILKGIPLFIEISEQRIPFFIEDFSLDASGEKCIIKFEFIDSDIEAKTYVGCDIYNEETLVEKPSGHVQIKNYLGFSVLDTQSGKEFTVTDYYDSPDNPIFVLKKNKIEVLLPANASYITSVDIPARRILAEFPDGLIM